MQAIGSSLARPTSLARRRRNWIKGAVSSGGSVLGMTHKVVKPPLTAASAPVATVSFSSEPGSLKWQCKSMKPGETTNPAVATGDGHALAYRAGAELRDMEFMQFHPTVLYIAGSSRSLISEAVRGEGAYLVDRAGERFMLGYDELSLIHI